MRKKFQDQKTGEWGEIDILAKDSYGNLTIVEVKSSLRHYTGNLPQIKRYKDILRDGPAHIGLDVKQVIIFVTEGFNNQQIANFQKNHSDEENSGVKGFKFMQFSEKSGLRRAS